MNRCTAAGSVCRAGLVLIAGALLLGFAFQGSRGIYAPDEGIYVSIAQAMTQTGDYLIPRLHHEPWLDTPPLSLWGVAGGLRFLAANEWGARVFHALCYVLSVAALWWLGSLLGGSRTGLMAGAVYATMALPLAAASIVTPDMPLALWTVLEFVLFWKSVAPGARHSGLWKMLLCVVFGLAFFTAGLAALIPAAVMFLFLLLRGETIRYFATPWILPGILLFSMLAFAWYAAVAFEIKGALSYFFDEEIIGNILLPRSRHYPNPMGMVIYLPVLVAGALPWSPLWLAALGRVWRNLKDTRNWKALRDDPASLLLACWIAVPLLLLCATSSRSLLYALPVFPALALATARMRLLAPAPAPWRGNAFGLSGRRIALLALWIALAVGIKAAAAWHPDRRDMRALQQAVHDILPRDALEIVSVNEHLEGLGFYSAAPIERVTTLDDPYPFFIPAESLEEDLPELSSSAFAHVFLSADPHHAARVRENLRRIHVDFRESELPFGRVAFVCPRNAPVASQVSLGVLGDPGHGKGKSRQYDVAAAFWRLYVERSFTDGVLYVGDNLHAQAEDADDLPALARRAFERPQAPLIQAGVPVYVVLGNHDNDYGLESFELTYPPFHLNGQRYWSRVFGAGLVEVFGLDSNPLNEDDPEDRDPAQLVWLDETLARSRAVWKVVVLHHPVYSTATRHRAQRHLTAALEPIFVRHGVNLVLQGHNHVYERLKPVRGVLYVTVGNSGDLRFGDLKPDAPERLAGNDRSLGFALLEFGPTAARITAYDDMMNVVDKADIPASPAQTPAPAGAAGR